MMPTFTINKKIQLNAEFWAMLSVVLFFSWRLVHTVTNYIFGSGTVSLIVALTIVYLPFFFACVMAPRKYIKFDFIFLLVIILLFFLITYLTHPDYAYYYSRSTYGVWDHVLVPYRGIYAYLFIRLLDEPKKIIRVLKISGWLMFIYFIYWYYTAMQRGYWYGVMGQNATAEMDYSVEFGYALLPFALLFLYEALKRRKWHDIIAAIASIVLLFLGGSRGPILFVGLFLVLYIVIEIKNARRKGLIITGVIIAVAALYAVYYYLFAYFSRLISLAGGQSRFLSSLLSGTLSDDTGRLKIWEAALKMIRDHPLGYGAMGSRHVLADVIIVGYPHSIILEMLIDFGVVIGGIFLVIIFYQSIKMLFFNDNESWRELFLVFFSAACSLFISMTFWSVPTFWVCFGLVISQRRIEGKGRFRINLTKHLP